MSFAAFFFVLAQNTFLRIMKPACPNQKKREFNRDPSFTGHSVFGKKLSCGLVNGKAEIYKRRGGMHWEASPTRDTDEKKAREKHGALETTLLAPLSVSLSRAISGAFLCSLKSCEESHQFQLAKLSLSLCVSATDNVTARTNGPGAKEILAVIQHVFFCPCSFFSH